MSPAIALGEPSWQINADGRWDFVPVVIAALACVALRLLFRTRLKPLVVLAVILAAPVYAAIGDAVGFPLATSVTMLFAVAAAIALRRGRNPPAGRLPHV